MKIQSFRLLSSVVVLAALAACGGGGGGGAGSTAANDGAQSSQPTATAPTRTDFALVTASPAANYPPGAAQAALYTQLNSVRLATGVGAVTQSAALDASAAAHLNYLAQHGRGTDPHSEVAGQTGFTGVDPMARAKAAGYTLGMVTEAMNFTTSPQPSVCLDTLLDSVYHQNAALGGWRDVGIAFSDMGDGTYGCAFELGVSAGASEQLQDTGVVRHYPYDGETGVIPMFLPAAELPNPMPDYDSNFAGEPILASMRTFAAPGAFSVAQFTLTDAAGNPVSARLIAGNGTSGAGLSPDPVGYLQPGEVYLVPRSPLLSATTYKVKFAGTSGTQPYTASWSFTTR